jgi:GT2 family glycosyltransferase
MTGMTYTIVIPVLNQLRYTQQCVESLRAHGIPVESLLVIDNGSTDDTPQWLAAHPEIRSVRNAVNLGCGGAWTQGALLADSDLGRAAEQRHRLRPRLRRRADRCRRRASACRSSARR